VLLKKGTFFVEIHKHLKSLSLDRLAPLTSVLGTRYGAWSSKNAFSALPFNGHAVHKSIYFRKEGLSNILKKKISPF
jgi:hypothetical protein